MLDLFQSPSDNLVRAAKTGAVDNLQGTVDALAWGRKPPIGTGAQFDIMYSWKVLFFFFCGCACVETMDCNFFVD